VGSTPIRSRLVHGVLVTDVRALHAAPALALGRFTAADGAWNELFPASPVLVLWAAPIGFASADETAKSGNHLAGRSRPQENVCCASLYAACPLFFWSLF
jgi:hypothetical protein